MSASNDIVHVKFDNGDCYEGRMTNGKMDGGKYVFANGIVFQGDFNFSADNKFSFPDNWGKVTWPNGSTYEGQFVNGRMSGDGVFIHYNNHARISTRFLDWEIILNQMILPDGFYYDVPTRSYYRNLKITTM